MEQPTHERRAILKAERAWFLVHYSRELRKSVALALAEDLRGRSEINLPWPETTYDLFPNSNIIWNVQKIFLDDNDHWDGNLKLVLAKEKLGLVRFFHVTHQRNGRVPLDVMHCRMSVLSEIIPSKRLWYCHSCE